MLMYNFDIRIAIDIRIPMSQSHGNSKTIPWSDSGEWQGIPLVQIWMLPVCAESINQISFSQRAAA